MSSPLDLVIYGATGFTGSQAAHYIARRVAPGTLRWAIAGRSQPKLDALAASIEGHDVPTIVANSGDPASIDAMVEQARVVLTTVGPYARYGSPVVAACARLGRDYVDITGEVPWVRRMIDAHHEEAAASGARIVPFCGFDSVPSDLGTWLAAEACAEAGTQLGKLGAYFQAKGGVNGGTIATAFLALENERPRDLAHPFLLDPDNTIDRARWSAHADPKSPWRVAPLGRWAAPFFMGPVNTRVVRRSVALAGERYTEDFGYQEGMLVGRRMGALSAGAATAGMAGLTVAAALAPTRALLRRMAPSPGEGPSEATMNEGFVRVHYVGEAADGRAVRGELRAEGDPGNRVTVQFLAESALCLAERDEGVRAEGGVWTPAHAFARPLLVRTRATGMRWEMALSSP